VTAQALGMTAAELLDHEWTEEDVNRLPDDGRWFEILDGRLLRKPVPTINHQDLCDQIYDALRALPARTDRTLSLQPREVLLAVEVASDGTEADDRLPYSHDSASRGRGSPVPAEYAAAGVPW